MGEEPQMKTCSPRTGMFQCALTLLLSLGWAEVAWAHVQGGQAAGFMTGLHHPWSGLDHILAMIAVGLWGAQLGSPALWLLPIAFPMMMAVGAMMGLVGVFAIFHGHAHGTELPAGQSGFLYSMGFVIATGCLHGVGVALGLVNSLPMGKLALRGAGTFIAVMGMFFLWKAMM